MMKNQLFTLFLLFFLLSFGCQNAEKPSTTADTPPENQAQQRAAQKLELPGLPQEMRDKLFYECDYIDLIFYQQNFSMSLNEKPSIEQIIAIVSADPATYFSACQASGRAFFQSKGRVITEADVHFSDNNCAYFVFMENGKPAYANNMNESGVSLFKSYLMQGAQIQQQH